MLALGPDLANNRKDDNKDDSVDDNNDDSADDNDDDSVDDNDDDIIDDNDGNIGAISGKYLAAHPIQQTILSCMQQGPFRL